MYTVSALKSKVSSVAEGIVDVVRVGLPKELEKEMIKAKLHYQIIENVTFVE